MQHFPFVFTELQLPVGSLSDQTLMQTQQTTQLTYYTINPVMSITRDPLWTAVEWYIKLGVPALYSCLLSNQNAWLKPDCYIKYVSLYHPSSPLVQSYCHHVLTDSAERFITVALTARITACCRGHAVCCYSDLVKEVEERRKSRQNSSKHL